VEELVEDIAGYNIHIVNRLVCEAILGSWYYYGKGVPQDYAEAYFWYDLAAASEGGETAERTRKIRDEAAFHLTPANLSREQERVRKWFEAHHAKP
jgi:hypothetical protein